MFSFFQLRKHLLKNTKKIADVWKEYDATTYVEYVGYDTTLEGTLSFPETLNIKDNEVVIFGWGLFPPKEIRHLANKQVPKDPRMEELIKP